jgi:SAM-dependent methyltransferase
MRPTFEHQWRERFTEFAELCDDEAGIAGWSATGLEARVRRFRSLWRPAAAGALWLDAGCGAGTYMRMLVEEGQRVVGADYSVPALQKGAGRNLGPVVAADVRALPFQGGMFDGVLCFGVMQALTDSRAAVAELARQLKPGGELWLDALNAGCIVHIVERLRRRMRGKPQHLRHESASRVRALLREQGLVDVKLHWMPIAPARHRWLQRLFDAAPAAALMAALPPFGTLASHAFILRARRPA